MKQNAEIQREIQSETQSVFRKIPLEKNNKRKMKNEQRKSN